MQMLVGKTVFIYLRDDKNRPVLLDKFICTDRYMDLRGVPCINEYPVIVNWLVKFVAGHLRKKYPRLLKKEPLQQVSKKV
jgi:hypothetical protein